MKKILTIAAICLIAVSGTVKASFPVGNKVTTVQNENLSPVTTNAIVEEQANQVDFKQAKKEFKKAIKEAKKNKGVDTEFIITILLCIFLGGLAAHRWYAGKPAGWNILFILTGGGCGIWWLVDFINILTGKF